MRAWFVTILAAAVLGLSGCGYNSLQQQDESVKAAWSEVVNQYQRRADLIPNLVNTVKGYAAQEQKALIGVTVARNRYIQAVQNYNVTVRSFPVNLTAKMFGFQVKPNFTVANEQQIATAPTVSFDTSPPGTQAAPSAAAAPAAP